jgi:hypothetical protein
MRYINIYYHNFSVHTSYILALVTCKINIGTGSILVYDQRTCVGINVPSAPRLGGKRQCGYLSDILVEQPCILSLCLYIIMIISRGIAAQYTSLTCRKGAHNAVPVIIIIYCFTSHECIARYDNSILHSMTRMQ